MTNTEKIAEIRRRAKSEQWDYPKHFNALKDAGVTSYHVDVASEATTFFLNSDTWQELISPREPLHIAPRFDQDKLKKALARHQNKETTYEQFLAEIAQAGVKSYVVTFDTRKVTYKGASGEKFDESIPSF